jgi:hypothetical protein
MSELDVMRQRAAEYAAELQRLSYDVQVLQWETALDNYEPVARSHAHGFAVEYSGTLHDPDTGRTAEYATAGITMFCDDMQLPLGNVINNGPHAIALMDDGLEVHPYYCAAWHHDDSHVIWHTFPVNGINEKTGQSYTMDNWMLGPRRAYHFKVTRLYLHSGNDWRPEEPGTEAQKYERNARELDIIRRARSGEWKASS